MLPNIDALAYVNKAQEYKPGMAYMIEVFTTWCPPCRGMIPHLAELPTKYPNVYLVAVTEEEQDKVEAFAQKIPPMKSTMLLVTPKERLRRSVRQRHRTWAPRCVPL